MRSAKNPPLIEYSERFNKQRKVVPLEIKIAFVEVQDLFMEDPNHPSLRNHALKGRLAGYRSIDVAEDYRVLYKSISKGKRRVVRFHMIGNHKELYGE
jgi:addiction module RelE/StbE family toxin